MNLLALEAQQVELKRQLGGPEAPPLLHPSISDLYRQKVTHLYEALNATSAASPERARRFEASSTRCPSSQWTTSYASF